MLYDCKKLQPFEFVKLNSKQWGSMKCIIIKNRKEMIEYLPIEPYIKADNRNYEHFTFADHYHDIEGFSFLGEEELFYLLGMTDERIISAMYKAFDNE